MTTVNMPSDETAATIRRERPILFSGAMVRALLAGTKTQTRRVRGLERPNANAKTWAIETLRRALAVFRCIRDYEPCSPVTARCPYGAPGDRLWVRETCFDNDNGGEWIYRADGEFIEQFEMVEGDPKWTPSIHCPRRASRITLEITDVRVERLQSISESDANAEGCDLPARDQAWTQCRQWYRALWNEINGAGSWDANPYVWALTFKRVAP